MQHVITQKELARITGISQSHISELESGVKSPSLKMLVIICNALKTHPHILMVITEKQ